jgi:dipeptidyl aminopeptidase/acylaminoacyl peptidase
MKNPQTKGEIFMHKLSRLLVIAIIIGLLLPNLAIFSQEKKQTQPRPLEIPDMMEWNNIRPSVLTNDGKWFGYGLFPTEGDGQVIIKELKGEKEYKFDAGSSSPRIAFSDDGKWAAFSISPNFKEAKKIKKQKKKSYNKVALIDLKSGDKKEFEKMKSFAFSEENPNWLVMQKYPSESQSKEKEKWSGSDLILFELATSKELNIGNVSQFAFDKTGQWLALVIDSYGQSGNGVQLRNMKTGVITPLDNEKAEYKRLSWTEEGDGLTVLKGVKDDDYKDKLFSVVGFKNFTKSNPSKFIYNPKEDDAFPEKMTISPNRTAFWTKDLSALVFGIHEAEEKEDKKKDEKKEDKDKADKEEEVEKKDEKDEKKPTSPPKNDDDEKLPEMVIWHWKDKRMQPQQQVQESRDKNFNYLAIYHVKDKKFVRLADDVLRNVSFAPEHKYAIGRDNQNYELIGNLEGRRYQDIYVVNIKTGEKKLAKKKLRWYNGTSPNGTHFLYYEDGNFHTYDIAAEKSYNITKDVPTSFINEEDDHNVKNPPTRSFGWTKDDASVLLYNNWDIWNVPVHGGKAVNLTIDGKEKGIRYQSRTRLDPKEKGIDLSKSMYVTAYEEWTKKAGIALVNGKKPNVKMLLWDDAAFYGLRKAKNADVFIYTKQTYKDYPDYYVTNSSLKNGKKITEANPQQKDFLWSSGAKLVDFTSDKGKKLQAALYLPANYEEGKSYPTIVYIYEKLSQGLNRYLGPRVRGFNEAMYTSHGYAVLKPDITYQVNDPGMSSVWCVVPAVKAAVETGIVDKDAVGIHGHSWGGYQSSFLVTQTDIFKAVVTGAPLTNMISMYSSVYWNSGSANQPIFESSQGRFYGGYWDNLDAYTRNSPVYFAQNVKTPMIILHNDKDGAVDWNQGIEYFNTLRRLNKPVVMLQYKGENHGLRKIENNKDYTVRMMEFFNHYLKGKEAPKWWKEGVKHLDIKDHLKERQKLIKKPEKEKKEKIEVEKK